MGEGSVGTEQLSETVTLGIDDGLAVIVIDNPPVNALSGSVIDGMELALERLNGDAEIRLAILLCAGDKAGVKQRRFYKQLIERADRLYARHLAALASRRQKKEK